MRERLEEEEGEVAVEGQGGRVARQVEEEERVQYRHVGRRR